MTHGQDLHGGSAARPGEGAVQAGAKEAGFLDYFEQVNFSGGIITPDVMNADMIQLDA